MFSFINVQALVRKLKIKIEYQIIRLDRFKNQQGQPVRPMHMTQLSHVILHPGICTQRR